MKPKKANHPHNDGFTLIEVIVTLVIAAIMGTILVSLMGKNLTGSAVPVSLVGDQYKIVQEMEKITSEYREEIKNGTLLDINTFKAYVDGKTYPTGISVATVLSSLTSTGGTPYVTQPVLRVTLQSGDQSVQAFFTE